MEPIDSPAQVVCDAGPLIHLDELSYLNLLSDFAAVLVPGAVWSEVEQHRPRALEKATVPLVRVAVEISREPGFDTLVRALNLGAGEQAALSLMQSYPGAIFLSDDAAARLAAKAFHFRSQGTVGILLRSLRRGQCTRDQVLGLLQDIPKKSTLHIRRGLLQSVIEDVKAGRAESSQPPDPSQRSG